MKTLNKSHIRQSLRKVDNRTLKQLIYVAQDATETMEYDVIYSYLRNNIHVDVTLEDVVKCCSGIICQIENELMYKQYGY